MTYTFRLIRFLLAFVVLGGVTISAGQAQNRLVRFGIAIDGPWERNERIRTTFEREITQLLQAEYEVRFPPGKRLQADWTAAGVNAVLDRLLTDPEVDYVLTLGPLTSNAVGRRGPLPKPVIAPYVIGAALQGIPVEIRERQVAGQQTVEQIHVSGVPNLSYVNILTDFAREVSRIRLEEGGGRDETVRQVVPMSHGEKGRRGAQG
jgi:hypothetical protein